MDKVRWIKNLFDAYYPELSAERPKIYEVDGVSDEIGLIFTNRLPMIFSAHKKIVIDACYTDDENIYETPDPIWRKEILYRLRMAIENSGQLKSDLADKIGVSRQWFYKIMNSDSKFDLDIVTATRLAHAIGMTNEFYGPYTWLHMSQEDYYQTMKETVWM